MKGLALKGLLLLGETEQVAQSAQSALDYSKIDTSAVIPTISAGIIAVAGVVISAILIRKGYNFVKSQIKKA